MGLFSSIGKIAGGVLGGVLGSKSSKGSQKAIDAGAQAQLQGVREAIAAQERAREQMIGTWQPWLNAGEAALGDMGDLLGINGAGAQGTALAALEKSPLFQSLLRQGQEGILQSGSATGQLRGGNIRDAMADFRGDTLANTIQQQLANLGTISGTGAPTAVSNLSSGFAGNISNLLGQQGGINANAILGKQGVANQNANNWGGILGGIFSEIGGLF